MLPQQGLAAAGQSNSAKPGYSRYCRKKNSQFGATMAAWLVITARSVTTNTGHLLRHNGMARFVSREVAGLDCGDGQIGKTGWCGTSGDADGMG